jgi:hypothetical protein
MSICKETGRKKKCDAEVWDLVSTLVVASVEPHYVSMHYVDSYTSVFSECN